MSYAPHDKLVAYQKAREAVRILTAICCRLPSDWGDLRNQVQRASTSITLNLAEGAAEFSPAEKARFYRMSRRSAAECMAALDSVDVLVPHEDNDSARQLLGDVIGLTTGLGLAAEGRRKR